MYLWIVIVFLIVLDFVFIYLWLRSTKEKIKALQIASAAEKMETILTEQISQLQENLSNSELLRQQYLVESTKLTEKLQQAEIYIDEQKKFLESSKSNLVDQFQHIAKQALEGNNRQFLDLAKATFDKESSDAKNELKLRQQAIEGLVNPLRETLDKYQVQVNALEKERQKSYFKVEEELQKVYQTGLTLTQETSALKNALKKPHVRGRWGELQLKNCIELSGMSEFCDVSFQDSTTLESGDRLVPDMTVRMPGGRIVVVDSKTPIDAFMSSMEATSEEQKQIEMQRHGKHVREHVKMLSTKAYNERLQDAADFTVMFLPNESFLYAALETQSDLMEYALQKKILIATPPTLIGFLKVIRFGWNEEKLAENAKNISSAATELHKRVCDFVDSYMSMGKALDKAKSEYEKGLSRLNSRVLVQARRIESLGAKSNKSLPEGLGESEDLLERQQNEFESEKAFDSSDQTGIDSSAVVQTEPPVI